MNFHVISVVFPCHHHINYVTLISFSILMKYDNLYSNIELLCWFDACLSLIIFINYYFIIKIYLSFYRLYLTGCSVVQFDDYNNIFTDINDPITFWSHLTDSWSISPVNLLFNLLDLNHSFISRFTKKSNWVCVEQTFNIQNRAWNILTFKSSELLFT